MPISLIWLVLVFFSQLRPAVDKKEIVVIIPSYNNMEWYERNLSSILSQQYTDWRAYYIDDCSTDGTASAVENYCKIYDPQHKITLIKNNQRMGALYNIYTTIWALPDDVIVATIDGDDWLPHNGVFARINKEYRQVDAWMTYGEYQIYPDNDICCKYPIPQMIIEANSYRENRWYTSHLRTFYAWLFKKIKKEDLMYGGAFFEVTWDMAFMFPMLEMSGNHARHIPEVMYVYNQATAINDYKLRLPLVMEMESFIRTKNKYQRLTKKRS